MKIFKKTLAMILCLLMLMSIAPLSASAAVVSGATGSGTKNDPFIVDNFSEFKNALELKNGTYYVKVVGTFPETTITEFTDESVITVSANAKVYVEINTEMNLICQEKGKAEYPKALISVLGELSLSGSGRIIFSTKQLSNISVLSSTAVIKVNADNARVTVNDFSILSLSTGSASVVFVNKGVLETEKVIFQNGGYDAGAAVSVGENGKFICRSGRFIGDDYMDRVQNNGGGYDEIRRKSNALSYADINDVVIYAGAFSTLQYVFDIQKVIQKNSVLLYDKIKDFKFVIVDLSLIDQTPSVGSGTVTTMPVYIGDNQTFTFNTVMPESCLINAGYKLEKKVRHNSSSDPTSSKESVDTNSTNPVSISFKRTNENMSSVLETVTLYDPDGNVVKTVVNTFHLQPKVKPIEPIQVDSIAITDIDLPVANATPDKTATTESTFRIGSMAGIVWYRVENGTREAMGSDEKFEAGKTYVCYMQVFPNSGYLFPSSKSEFSVTINGETAVIGGSYSNSIAYVEMEFIASCETHSFDGSVCAACGYDASEDCGCKCHQGGIAGFFFKIVLFFQKLFGQNKVCACGMNH
jgi:hypothetical protein